MKKQPSIRKRISQFTLIGMFSLAALFAATVVTQSLIQRHQQVEKLEVELLATIENQGQKILGNLIIPEEREALPLVLDRIKAEEGLGHISFNQSGDSETRFGQSCRRVTSRSSICNGGLSGSVQVVTRLEYGKKLLGFLVKSKSLPKLSWISFSGPQLWVFVITMLIWGGMMMLVQRFIRKDLCDGVQNIVSGLEQGREARKQIVKRQEYRELRHLARALYGLQSQIEQKSKEESLGELARQVAHDLRSPLSLLKVVTAESDHPMTEPEKRLAKQAVSRIEQVSDSLLKENDVSDESFTTRNLSRMIENLIEEKRYRQQGRIEFLFDNQLRENLELSSKPDTIERTLSNLMDNAIEATEGQAVGSVRLVLSVDGNNDIFVDILDTGMGFENEKFSEGSSKKFGHGLGVKAARKDLAEQNGALTYSSLVGAGTATRIRLA